MRKICQNLLLFKLFLVFFWSLLFSHSTHILFVFLTQEPRAKGKKHRGHHTLQDHAPHTAFLPHGDLDGYSVLNTSRDASDTLMGESVGIWVCFSTVTGTFVGHFMQEIKASFLCTPWALDLTLCLAFSKCQDIATFYTFVKI